MTHLTIFTAPKPFTNPHIALIQKNAVRSWMNISPDVSVMLIGDEEGMPEAAAELKVTHLPGVECSAHGTPLIRSLFSLARQYSESPLLAFVNADILLLPDFITASRQVSRHVEDFLIIGQRWDLSVTETLEFSPAWDERLIENCFQQGKRHPRGGSDYFIFPRRCYTHVPEIVVGRAGWDNWMIYEARRQGWAAVDASESIQIIHQDHDYSHLPDNQPHYRLPETAENIRLGGGQRTIFTLLDTDHRLVDGELQRPQTSWKKLWREIEIFPLIKLRSKMLGQLFFAILHPLKAYLELRGWIRIRRM